ncbi:Probable plastid-lipid-associated protein 4, chloroplastic [Galdieria sulphuraria]|uniref:Fibrillin-like protein n=1 Tax=Galdieria sulphuraria TaxID=130081 RepID=M2WR93_GALSU|nr:fibrillin-like protein [Galdieria sulphuraria]EME26325.1 fibrillin-like protein [Galdieria sulphuraria]GJD06514.1 Probable plastid-lipid-associated protein 4, chloroplastic [Galdieria sulphuraria]|eukprot:XP_005702845.1 fibrillin-like protein [Galdieria sulphuraria]
MVGFHKTSSSSGYYPKYPVYSFVSAQFDNKPWVKRSLLSKFSRHGLISIGTSPHNTRRLTKACLKATAVSSQITIAQQDLLDYVLPLDLGRKALNNSAMKAVVNEKLALLELMNPIPVPVDSPELDGRWRLLYTDSELVLGVSRPRWFQPVGALYQTIFLDTLEAENAETIKPFGISLENKVWATLTKSPPKKVFLQFRRFQFGPIRFSAPTNARGFLETTFLDHRMRISRDHRKHVFVLVKE